MNMGQTSMALDVVALGKDGSATVAQTLQEIYQDGCGNPTGERRRAASVIALSSHGITAERHEEACPQ
jgi:hypothetical protein